MEIFGHLERLVDDLYPYRWFLATLTLVVVTLLGVVGYRRGWQRAIARHPRRSAVIALLLLAVSVPLGAYTLSPLWTRTMLNEESPLALAAARTVMPDTAMVALATSTTAPTRTPTARASASAPADQPTHTPTVTELAQPRLTTTEPTQTEPTPTPEPTATPEPAATATPEPPTAAPFEPHVTHAGSFSGADEFHFGSGTALLIEVEPGVFTLRFEEFSVRNGPDLRVYLSTSPDGLGDDSLDLGSLRATDGSFNMAVPVGVNPSAYASVVIWCEPFAVLFAWAPLGPVS